MSLNITQDDGIVVISPNGPMNAITAPSIQEEINGTMAGVDSRVALNLANVPFVSSHGLRTVIQTARLVKSETGTTLVVCGMEAQIDQIFRLAGLNRIVEICQDVDAMKELTNTVVE